MDKFCFCFFERNCICQPTSYLGFSAADTSIICGHDRTVLHDSTTSLTLSSQRCYMPAVVSPANDFWLDSRAKPPTYSPEFQLLLLCSFLDKKCRELSGRGFTSASYFCSKLAIWVDTWLLLSETGDKTYITIPLLGIVVLVFNASTWEKMQEGWEFRSSLSHIVKLLNKKQIQTYRSENLSKSSIYLNP